MKNNYPKIADLTSDIVVFSDSKPRKVLLIKRKNNPFKGIWAFPGGFLELGETFVEAAQRELYEETNIDILTENLHFFGVYDDPDRDPRGRIISTVFTIDLDNFPDRQFNIIAKDDAAEVAWFSICNMPPLAFDHLDVFLDLFN